MPSLENCWGRRGVFALLVQPVHGLPDFVDGCAAIDMMHLVEVNVFDLQALWAGIAGFEYAVRIDRDINRIGHGLVNLVAITALWRRLGSWATLTKSFSSACCIATVLIGVSIKLYRPLPLWIKS